MFMWFFTNKCLTQLSNASLMPDTINTKISYQEMSIKFHSPGNCKFKDFCCYYILSCPSMVNPYANSSIPLCLVYKMYSVTFQASSVSLYIDKVLSSGSKYRFSPWAFPKFPLLINLARQYATTGLHKLESGLPGVILSVKSFARSVLYL